MAEEKEKHVLIQGPPPRRAPMEEHPILPNPLADILPPNIGIPEELSIYGDSVPDEVNVGKRSFLSRLFKSLPVKIGKNSD